MPETGRRIGVIVPMELDYSRRLLEGAMEYVEAQRGVTLVDLPYPVDTPDRLKLGDPFPFDAALIWASPDAKWVQSLLVNKIPLISASGDWPVEQIPCIAFDTQAVIDLAVSHLASLQPAKVLHLEFLLKGMPLKQSRAERFQEAAQKLGIGAESASVFYSSRENEQEISRRLPLEGQSAKKLQDILNGLPRRSAVWCGEDRLARRVCEVALEMGLEIPADLAVLGFGDFPDSKICRPPLSSIPLPGAVIGYQAFATLDRMLSGDWTPPPFTPVTPPPVIVRESTAGLPDKDLMARARDFLQAHACEGLTIRELSDDLNLSPQNFHARYVKRFGRSPGEEIRNARLAAAKRYLRDPRLTISRVAGLCGFNQQSKFSNFFRRETGTSPREWRQTRS